MSDTVTAKPALAKTAWGLTAIVCFMGVLAFASVPLYRLFCQVTGYGGTTQRSDSASLSDAIDQTLPPIRIQFVANTASHLPWKFKPVQHEITLKPGEAKLAFYQVQNIGGRTITGSATFNVTPQKAGQYFVKTECFCFTEQILKPGEMQDMPVQFFVEPDLLTDPNTREIRTITLSYTFFEQKEAS